VRTALEGMATSLSSVRTRKVARHDDMKFDLDQLSTKIYTLCPVAWTQSENLAVRAAAGADGRDIFILLLRLSDRFQPT
jgi:hypothetical protein